jgi:hypothetical protein
MTVGEAYFLHERTWDPCLLSSQIARKPHFGCVPVPARGNSEIEISSRQHSGSTALRSVQALPNLERPVHSMLTCAAMGTVSGGKSKPAPVICQSKLTHGTGSVPTSDISVVLFARLPILRD